MAWLEVSTDFVLKRVSCLSLEPSPSCSLRMGFSLSSQSDIRNLKTLILLSPWFQLHVVGTGQGGASKDRWRIKAVTGVLGSTVILGNIYSFQILRASWSIILLVIPSCKSALAFVTVYLLLESQLVRNAAGGLFPRILVGRWDSATYPGGDERRIDGEGGVGRSEVGIDKIEMSRNTLSSFLQGNNVHTELFTWFRAHFQHRKLL